MFRHLYLFSQQSHLSAPTVSGLFCVLEFGRGEAVGAKREGEFATVVQIVLDHVPGHPLA